MTPQDIVELAANAAMVILTIALLLTVYRAVAGPGLPDRVIALDMLVGIVMGFIALVALKTGYILYIDIAIALGLVGFLATIAFARFIFVQGAMRLPFQDGAHPAAGQSEMDIEGREREAAASPQHCASHDQKEDSR